MKVQIIERKTQRNSFWNDKVGEIVEVEQTKTEKKVNWFYCAFYDAFIHGTRFQKVAPWLQNTRIERPAFNVTPNVEVTKTKQVRKRNRVYPIEKMNIGDSFAVPAKLLTSARYHANSYGKQADKKFKTRRINRQEGRIWRVE